MFSPIACIRSNRDRDAGFSLVEVMVAIAIIAVVAISAGSLAIAGINAASTQQRRQIAVTIASGTMESINSMAATVSGSTNVSALYTGRYRATVHTAWQANSGVVGVGQTYEASDPTATPASSPVVPISPYTSASPLVRSGTNYSVTVLIGTCYQPTTAPSSGNWDCSTLSGHATAPNTTPTGYTPLMRVMVIVRWTPGIGCGTSGCKAVVTSLVDSHSDLLWVSHG